MRESGLYSKDQIRVSNLPSLQNAHMRVSKANGQLQGREYRLGVNS
jgi:hypothetical protein